FATLNRGAAKVLESRPTSEQNSSDYQRWIERYEEPARDANEIRGVIAGFSYTPKVSILMPVYETPHDFLEKAIRSVRQQYYQNWELCIHDDGSRNEYIKPLLERYAC